MTRYYSSRRKLRRSRNGILFGVCDGIAKWRDYPVGGVRLVFVLLSFAGFLSLWVYLILALILPIEKDSRYEYEYEDKDKSEKFDKEKDWENRFWEQEN
ncbi:MAG: hypothetical protein B6D68_01885 [spirochete symbiont of Stewartia floridana]|nr:MAG: hypothetical protein B6D68_01885 [spirochete symbiont of Stewartia floridana]